MWSEWCSLTTLTRGAPSEVPFTEYMKPSVREFDETGGNKIDASLDGPWVVACIGACLRSGLAVRRLSQGKGTAFTRR